MLDSNKTKDSNNPPRPPGQKDELFQSFDGNAFSFDEKVANVFDDMILRSVPSYDLVQALSGEVCEQFLTRPGTIVDLGCSTGKTILSAWTRSSRNIKSIYALDNSRPMLEKCRQNCEGIVPEEKLNLICADISDFEVSNASVIFLNYTLQFIDPGYRLELLEKIFASLEEGGVLILSEKVTHTNKNVSDLLCKLHHQYKYENGYSLTEIKNKRDALENVLRPLSTEENFGLLQKAGFKTVEIVLKSLNFVTFLGVKH